jgi:V8-like Glu-specific endopeptidase
MRMCSGIRLKHRSLQFFHGVALSSLLVGGATAQELYISPSQGAIEQQAAQVQAYWTPERMSTARPKPTPEVDATRGVRVQSVVANRPADAYPTLIPGWNPSSGMPQPTSGSMKVFAPGSPEYERIMSPVQPMAFGSPPSNPVDYANYGRFQRWTWFGNYLTFPTSTIVKMFFTQNGGGFVCSGTVVNRNTVLTAGHCVSDGNGNLSTNILFCPSYFLAGGAPGAPHPSRGCWVGGTIVVPADWHTAENHDRDYACVVTSPTGTVVANSIGNVTGWAGVSANFPRNQPVFSTGYPSAAPFPGYHIIFTSAVEWYSLNLGGDANVSKYIGNDMTGGSSGGSWWLSIRHATAEYADVDGSNETDPFQLSGPFANGLNSHKRCAGSCFTPPTASGGTFWAEMGGPDFTSSGSDPRDVIDTFNSCASAGGG